MSLQLVTGCSVRLCGDPEELAEHVLTVTKALTNKPFRSLPYTYIDVKPFYTPTNSLSSPKFPLLHYKMD